MQVDSFLLYGCLGVTMVFLLSVTMAYRRQRHFFGQMNQLLGFHKNANDQLGHILKELKRHSKQLAEIIDEAANSPAYDDAFGEEEAFETTVVDDVPIERLEVSRKIYIGNLEYSTTESELMNLFDVYGVIESVNIPLNRYNGRARGFGFVTFETIADAERAVELNGQMFKNRTLQVNFAKERD